MAPVETVTVAIAVLPPSVAVIVAVPVAEVSVYVNTALLCPAATVTLGGSVPAFAGVRARPTVVATSAGTSSDTVNCVEPPAATAAVSGDRVTVEGASAAPSTRTCAVKVCTPSIAITGTSRSWVSAVTLTVAEVVLLSTRALVTVSEAGVPEMIITVVSPCAGADSVTVSAFGNVAALVVAPTRA